MEQNKCKNCIYWNREFSTSGICSELTKLQIQNNVIRSTTFDGRPSISSNNVLTHEEFGKDCPYFIIIGRSNLDRKMSMNF